MGIPLNPSPLEEFALQTTARAAHLEVLPVER